MLACRFAETAKPIAAVWAITRQYVAFVGKESTRAYAADAGWTVKQRKTNKTTQTRRKGGVRVHRLAQLLHPPVQHRDWALP